MITKLTYDSASALVRLKTPLVLLLVTPGDSMSSRSLSLLSLFESRFSGLGYLVASTEASELGSSLPETSCVRVPQLRIFRGGHLQFKSEGILTSSIAESALMEVS